MKGLGQHTEKQHEAKTAGEYRQAAEEHTQTLKSFWKNFLVSGLFVVAAIVIILACLAWFMNNSRVNATGVGVSAAGVRYNLLTDYTEEEEKGSNVGVYDSKMNVINGMLVNQNSNFNNTTEGGKLFPGASGKFKVKITPVATDLRDVQLTVTLAPSPADEETSTLLNGHIQFFTESDGKYYSAPMLPSSDGKRTITIPSSEFMKDGKTTEDKHLVLYWVWPERFSNLISTGGSQYDANLFAEQNESYQAFIGFLNKNRSYFFREASGLPETIDNSINNAQFALCTNQYDAADDYLGKKAKNGEAKYVEVSISAEEIPASGEGN